MSFSPYLFFSGNCAEAFERYHEIFGGELHVMTQGDVPEGARMPEADIKSVMHASLQVGADQFLMGSDDPTGDGGPKVGAAVAYSTTDAGESKRIFDALSEGGEVTGPFGPTFWSKGFGMCTDRFGIPWMVDSAEEPAAG
jgi:PhnB protein